MERRTADKRRTAAMNVDAQGSLDESATAAANSIPSRNPPVMPPMRCATTNDGRILATTLWRRMPRPDIDKADAMFMLQGAAMLDSAPTSAHATTRTNATLSANVGPCCVESSPLLLEARNTGALAGVLPSAPTRPTIALAVATPIPDYRALSGQEGFRTPASVSIDAGINRAALRTPAVLSAVVAVNTSRRITGSIPARIRASPMRGERSLCRPHESPCYRSENSRRRSTQHHPSINRASKSMRPLLYSIHVIHFFSRRDSPLSMV